MLIEPFFLSYGLNFAVSLLITLTFLVTILRKLHFSHSDFELEKCFLLSLWEVVRLLILSKVSLKIYDYFAKRSDLVKRKRDLFIGHAGVVYCSIVPFLMYKEDLIEDSINVFVHLIASTCFVFLFLTPIRSVCTSPNQILFSAFCTYTSISTIFVCYFLLLTCVEDIEKKLTAFYFQIIIACVNFGFFAELLVILSGGVEERAYEIDRRISRKPEKSEEKTEDSESIPERFMMSSDDFKCKSCLLHFSDKNQNRSPRILTKCGHTLCENCLQNMYKRTNNQHILCPFCRSKTLDSLKKLPKNHTVIGMLQVIRKLNK